jgi:2-dehydro-3-deoxygluconokinase
MSERIEIATLGEAMIVMDPLSRGPLRHVGTFAKRVGGAELNVAVGLSRLGHRPGWVGHLGDDEFGKEILTFLKGEGVDVSRAGVDSEAPTGLYFKERRALDQLRAYYYREDSAASRMRFEDLDVDYLLSGEVLHLTGIIPALSESCRDLTGRLVREANERNLPVSFDSNVRFRLFKGLLNPRDVLGPLVGRADVLFFSEDEADLLMGGSGPQSVRQAKKDIRAQTVVVHGAEGAFALDGD